MQGATFRTPILPLAAWGACAPLWASVSQVESGNQESYLTGFLGSEAQKGQGLLLPSSRRLSRLVPGW